MRGLFSEYPCEISPEMRQMGDERRVMEHLVKQFESSWKMIRQSIENVSDEKWAIGLHSIDNPWAEALQSE